MKKLIAAVALAAAVTLAGTAPALATTYPAPPPNAAVSDGTVGPGENFVFSGKGFLAGETLTITVTPGSAPASTGASIAGGASRAVPGVISLATTFTTTADSSGAFSFPVSISEPGVYTLTATGNTSGRTVSAAVTVTGTPAGTGLANTGTGTALANTGADSSLILWSLVGAGALAAGAASVITVRRRARATDAA